MTPPKLSTCICKKLSIAYFLELYKSDSRSTMYSVHTMLLQDEKPPDTLQCKRHTCTCKRAPPLLVCTPASRPQ